MNREFLFMHMMQDADKRLKAIKGNILRELKKVDDNEADYDEDMYTRNYGNTLRVIRSVISASLEAYMSLGRYKSEDKIYYHTVQTQFIALRKALSDSEGPKELLNNVLEVGINHLKSLGDHYVPYYEYLINEDTRDVEGIIPSLGTVKGVYPFVENSEANILNLTQNSASLVSYFKQEKDEGNITLFTTDVAEHKYRVRREEGYDRIAMGILKGTRISNNVFDLVVSRPHIDYSIMPTRTINARRERHAVKDSINYLRPGGKMILMVPVYRLHHELVSSLLKECEVLDYKRGYEQNAEIIILAEKRPVREKEIDVKEYSKLMDLASDYVSIHSIETSPFEKVAPKGKLDVPMFKGSVLSLDEIKEVLDASPCYNNMFDDIFDLTKGHEKQEPLIPFTSGQLGLVLTSGALDGVVQEGENDFHAVKGRVVKYRERSVEELTEDKERRVVDVISNRVQINIITPEGELKSLV